LLGCDNSSWLGSGANKAGYGVRRQVKRDAAFHRLPENFAAGISSKAASRFACRRTPYFLANGSIAGWLSRVLDLMRGWITKH